MKKKSEVAEMEVGPKITRQQYLEWRCYIYDIDIDKFKLSEKENSIKLHTKDMEISALKRALVTKEFNSQQAQLEKSKKEYKKFREELGQLIGVDMDGVVIDPVSLEVKRIDQKESK